MIRLSATTDFGLQLACRISQPLAAVQVADVALAVHKLMAAAVLMDAAACRWWPLLPTVGTIRNLFFTKDSTRNHPYLLQRSVAEIAL